MRLVEYILISTIIALVIIYPEVGDPPYFLLAILSMLLVLLYFPFGIFFLKKPEFKFSWWNLLFGFLIAIQALLMIYYLMFLAGWFIMKYIGLGFSILSVSFYIFIKRKIELIEYQRTYRIKIIFWFLIMFLIITFPHNKYVTYEFKQFPDLVKAYNDYSYNKSDSTKFQIFVDTFYKWKHRE